MGLTSNGSAAHSVASSPGAGLSRRVVSSALTWASAAGGRIPVSANTPSMTPATIIRCDETRCIIGGDSRGSGAESDASSGRFQRAQAVANSDGFSIIHGACHAAILAVGFVRSIFGRGSNSGALIVAFRSAKGSAFAERKATMETPQASTQPPSSVTST